ncbi:hypothetical protein FIBSPDRAFT_893070 [Athelia psychrophila]|uniref:Uncharacterized protein n=1 Tax=Athelia psychrophila TaxID=1759441 RepID=A0A166HP48_9AGAM|nr:hypothetical protein FIBSPDRAFT_893070 [Fibularhizoctonia sp. CBS 109695]
MSNLRGAAEREERAQQEHGQAEQVLEEPLLEELLQTRVVCSRTTAGSAAGAAARTPTTRRPRAPGRPTRYCCRRTVKRLEQLSLADLRQLQAQAEPLLPVALAPLPLAEAPQHVVLDAQRPRVVRLHPLPERPEHLALRPHGRAVGRASVLEEAQLELVRQVLRLEQQRVAEERARHLDVLPELEAEEHAHAPEARLVRQLVAPLAGALPALLHVLALVLPARPARLPLGHRSPTRYAYPLPCVATVGTYIGDAVTAEDRRFNTRKTRPLSPPRAYACRDSSFYPFESNY